MAHTSLGEVLEPAPGSGSRADLDNARRSINSKRLDFAVFGPDHGLRLGIEYHGAGHFQGTARLRDAVKRQVFERAGLPLLELAADVTEEEIRARVLAALAGPQAKVRVEPPLVTPALAGAAELRAPRVRRARR